MKPAKRLCAFITCIALLALSLSGCGGQQGVSFKVIAELNQEEFRVAFRKDDPLCEIVTAAMEELAAEGEISRLSSQYLGMDYSCMPEVEYALQNISVPLTSGRTLRIGVQDGVAPLSSSRDDGSFSGLIPDLAALVVTKLGWSFEYMVINSDNVAAELGSGNIDCAWMAASFSESAETVSLSPGWLRNSHQLVVLSDSGIRRKNALKGKILALTDPTAYTALKEDGLSEKVASVWYYETLSECFSALITGDCDALVIDSIVAPYYL